MPELKFRGRKMQSLETAPFLSEETLSFHLFMSWMGVKCREKTGQGLLCFNFNGALGISL